VEAVNLRVQEIVATYPGLSPEDFFLCDRCNCIMLKSRCKARLKKAIRKQKSLYTVESMDVNCLQCEQGREITGLWLDMPFKVCSVLNCRRAVTSSGLCDMHYTRIRVGTLSKVCCTCGDDVALADYHKKEGASDGRQSSCKKCMINLSSEKWKEGAEQNEKNRD
jgi:hypothetical protein